MINSKIESERTLSFFVFASCTSPIMEETTKGEWEMDELKLKLSTKFMRAIVSSLVSKALFKKFGYVIDVQIEQIEARTIDGTVQLKATVGAEMSKEELVKILASVDKD